MGQPDRGPLSPSAVRSARSRADGAVRGPCRGARGRRSRCTRPRSRARTGAPRCAGRAPSPGGCCANAGAPVGHRPRTRASAGCCFRSMLTLNAWLRALVRPYLVRGCARQQQAVAVSWNRQIDDRVAPHGQPAAPHARRWKFGRRIAVPRARHDFGCAMTLAHAAGRLATPPPSPTLPTQPNPARIVVVRIVPTHAPTVMRPMMRVPAMVACTTGMTLLSSLS